jgi:hypothetical protein
VNRRYPTALEFAEELRPCARVRADSCAGRRRALAHDSVGRSAIRSLRPAVIGSIVALTSALIVTLVLLDASNQEKAEKESALHLYEGGWYRDQASSLVAYSPPRALRYAIARPPSRSPDWRATACCSPRSTRRTCNRR